MIRMRLRLIFVSLLTLAASGWAAATEPSGYLMAQSLVSGVSTEGAFALVDKNQAAPLLVADDDWPGVRRAACRWRVHSGRFGRIQR